MRTRNSPAVRGRLVAVTKQSAVHFNRDFDAHGFGNTTSRRVGNFSGDAFTDSNGLLLLDRFADRVGDLLRPDFFHHLADCVGNRLGLLFLDHVADAVRDGLDLLFLDHVADTVGDRFGTFFFHHFADGVGDLFLDGLPFITYAFDLFLLNLRYPDFLADLAWCTFDLDDAAVARFENITAAF